MSPQRERELRKAQYAAAAGRRAEPDAPPAGRTAIRSKPIRITLDLCQPRGRPLVPRQAQCGCLPRRGGRVIETMIWP